MRVRILGSAAGGGVPQWNCACETCRLARTGAIPRRTQSSIAVSGDDTHWFLVNASPDLRAQIESFAPLQPQTDALRSTPIDGVLLTNADLDHTLGLFLLREGNSLRVHLSAPVRCSLVENLHVDSLLRPFTDLQWSDVPENDTPLTLRNGEPSGLLCRAIWLDGKPPRFARSQTKDESPGHAVAYVLTDARAGTQLVCAPEVGAVDERLLEAIHRADVVLFDGTFWTDDELIALRASRFSAREMGHLPVCESLPQLAALKSAARIIYIHINNTNPILDPNSSAAETVRRAGVEIGMDGLEFVL
jgi:pyrroloquinoline quinone biosynthesis protein B